MFSRTATGPCGRPGKWLAYVSPAGILPDDAYPLRDLRTLSPTLRSVVGRAIEAGQVWSCWAQGTEMWLFTCEMSLPLLGTWSRCAD